MFEVARDTAPGQEGKDQVNPGSVILSAEIWMCGGGGIIKGTNGAISAKTVTYDFEQLMEGATLLSSSAFGDALIEHM
ncbi:hypothetical protein AO065_04560 [Pseudomonas viridiflava]|uniref:isocitrate dehydrogenase (NADP(+)) n=1 Tax=Pseudomonas syringae pv. ribicola TaxID=55398 RepID=A0A0P9YF23_PSESI|nr:hypothetical protein PVFL_03210 [Pseudomonas viridiflava]KPY42322.1 hypothetical protein ALO47_200019 [Pseudomonas syringae pv. ribicola]KPZ28798.1 hypothetical protein ALO56_02403 [Pseudomonas viridiflava]OAG87148.1 hypothetical protein AO065_04560 [Pseudomonas viridiflava]ODJ94122.1 hypothetical protein BB779_20400 [Pseudomonas viridiflava]